MVGGGVACRSNNSMRTTADATEFSLRMANFPPGLAPRLPFVDPMDQLKLVEVSEHTLTSELEEIASNMVVRSLYCGRVRGVHVPCFGDEVLSFDELVRRRKDIPPHVM
eukprot:TRINITY_DN902_c0_g3_i1.p1 TRINITY_DN902_c0_g3~~TRINITY_DN902_c0_g3_i1.p1  ORF type:complete len:109 (+),score=19.87 TRINITY_DN902_c0_g3_i1:559-885(+)